MEVVIDTESINRLLRSFKPSRKRRDKRALDNLLQTSLDGPIQKKQVVVIVDLAGGLIDEWKRTCGSEYIQVLITRWEPLGGIRAINPVSKIERAVSRQLRQLGFSGTIDRLILRIALSTSDRTVVSEDPDFWDPANPRSRGDRNAPVASLCCTQLGIKVLLLATLLSMF